MSKHTTEYLHLWQRVGHGIRAWWFSETVEAKQVASGESPSHYAGAVPLAEVRHLLGQVVVGRGESFVTYTDDQGNRQTVRDERWSPVMNVKTGDLFGHFSKGSEWRDFNTDLTDNVSALVGGIGDLGVESCGILDFGARAYVQVGIPTEMHNDASGISYRPRLLAATALDGSLATTYKRVVGITVCDNTLAGNLMDKGETFKIKHTKNSGLKITEARQALALLTETATEFDAQLTALATTEFTDENFDAYLAVIAPITADMSKHAVTHAENRRDAFLNLWRNDNRVSPWRGTLLGAVQADNTYRQHVAIRRGLTDGGDVQALRAERNLTDAILGKSQDADLAAMATFQKILATA